jgi:hypothetical protein
MDPKSLTGILRRAGVLGSARVRGIVAEPTHRFILSHVVRLRLSYTGKAGRAPASLILKKRPSQARAGWGRQEVAFYQQVAPGLPARLVPRCFDAVWKERSDNWHLLLEDLSATHFKASEWPVPPAEGQCRAIVRAWARFHALWWDAPALGTGVGTWLDGPAMEGALAAAAEQTGRFVAHLGDRLTVERRTLYDRLLRAAPSLVRRYHSRRHMTIVHGDAHTWNCFLPREEGSDDVRLYDWDSWRVNVATSDLAYMMALHWFPGRRRQMEAALLDEYHAALLAHGVRGYDRTALDDDYRLSVLWQALTPGRQWANGIPAGIWWPHLERIHLAVEDLGCRELL